MNVFYCHKLYLSYALYFINIYIYIYIYINKLIRYMCIYKNRFNLPRSPLYFIVGKLNK